MKLRKSLLSNVVIALIISSSIVIFSQRGFFKRLDLIGLDLFFRLRGSLVYSPNIVIAEIDDANILKVGRWPWQRTWHAAMIKALKEFEVKQAYFDIIFSEKASQEEDHLVSQAIEEAGNVYLPFVFQGQSTDINKAFVPIEEYSAYLKGSGAINSFPDIDGSLRRIPLFFEGKDKTRLHVALKLSMDYLGLNLEGIDKDKLTLSKDRERLTIPLLDKDKMLINWPGRWKDIFVHYSFLDILQAYKDKLEARPLSIDVGPLKDSICLVGVTAIGLYDIISIPLEPEYPGIGVIAASIDNILNRNFLRGASTRMNWVLIYVLALIPSLLISGEKSARESLLALAVAVSFFVISFFFFKHNVWINISLPLLSLFFSYLTVTTYNLVRVSMERRSFFELAVTDELTRLYNIRYFKMILKAECLIAKSEVSKRFCIVMSDVDHFKHFNDTYGHQVGDLVLKEVADALRSSVRSSDVVARYGGEEMIIMLRGTSLESALAVAEKVRRNVESHLVKDDKNTYKVTISLGVSSFNPQDNEETVIKRADAGLYRAKDSGRNRVETEEKKVDKLIELYTPDRFKKVLTSACEMGKTEVDKRFCLVLGEIDKFKDQPGNLVLQEVAVRVREVVRSSDIIARLNDKKMAILLDGASLEDGLIVAEKVRKSIEGSLIKAEDKDYKITLSLGLASFVRRDDSDTLLKRAEDSLLRAREGGGNRVCAL
ncbi:MAG: diguanylate cyclase [Candidatus Omnitrophica bacterium]|nr:diguanylate cyclase [Candidatus Omnitrophota bacterium]